jgi:hypothetical protein
METYINRFGHRTKNILKRLVLLLIGSVFFISCLHDNRAEMVKSDAMKTIDQSLLLHKITNETLKNSIAQYDRLYNEGEKGIRIGCSILNDTISYSIVYQYPSSEPSAPMIKCESINGRDITMVFEDLRNDVELVAESVLELSKGVLSDEDYKETKEIIDANNANPFEKRYMGAYNDKVSIVLYFDRNQNLLYIDTLGIVPSLLPLQARP